MTPSQCAVCFRAIAVALCLYGAACGSGHAQTAGPIHLAQADQDSAPDDGQGEGAAALLVRITRLEDRLRTLTGQVEQLQFQNKKLEDALRKMQQDVDFRFQDLGRGQPGTARPAAQKRGDASDPGEADPALPPAEAPDAVETPRPAAPRPTKRAGDAFDPNSDPAAPGAPKPLGTTAASPPLQGAGAVPTSRQAASSIPMTSGPHAPMDLMPSSLNPARPAAASTLQEEVALPDAGARGTSPGNGGAGATGIRGEYESSFSFYKGGQYDAAVTGFQGFLDKHPADRLVPDATYFLGESYARLGRQREAAEQFLKLSTEYSKSNRAPDALLRLGVALNALGAKEQACATYQEVDRKYPAASSDVRTGVERELKRAKC